MVRSLFLFRVIEWYPRKTGGVLRAFLTISWLKFDLEAHGLKRHVPLATNRSSVDLARAFEVRNNTLFEKLKYNIRPIGWSLKWKIRISVPPQLGISQTYRRFLKRPISWGDGWISETIASYNDQINRIIYLVTIGPIQWINTNLDFQKRFARTPRIRLIVMYKTLSIHTYYSMQ